MVTITYNDPAGLAFTLESLRPLSRTWSALEWEHVVVDGSPAVSCPVLDGLPAGWPLVNVEELPGGVPQAFNQGLAVARGTFIWFLNGGDGLHNLAALARMLELLEHDLTADFVCGGAYLTRHGVLLYPTVPRRTLLGNILGRSWLYHQAVLYRRASLDRVGSFSTAYGTAGDYDYHVRCYVAGLRGRFTGDMLVDYDMGGVSSDVGTVFEQLKEIQRSHRAELPGWVNWANEIVRNAEHARIVAMRTLSATRLGASLRPAWTTLNRWLRESRRRPS